MENKYEKGVAINRAIIIIIISKKHSQPLVNIQSTSKYLHLPKMYFFEGIYLMLPYRSWSMLHLAPLYINKDA